MTTNDRPGDAAGVETTTIGSGPRDGELLTAAHGAL